MNKIRIDYSSMQDQVDEITQEQAFYLLLGAITDDTVELKRLSKFVYNLELCLTNDDTQYII